jgi:hypothetical protein
MRSSLLAASALLALSLPVAAEEFQFAPDDSPLYLRLSTGASFLFLPEVNSFGGVTDTAPYFFIANPDESYALKAAGFGGAATLGVNLDEAGVEFLSASRFEGTVHGYSVSDRDSRTILGGPGAYYDVIGVQGFLVSGVTPPGDPVLFHVEGQAEQIAGDMMLLWDYGPDSGLGHFTFGLGATGGYSAASYDASYPEDEPGFHTIEKARTNFVGPQASIDFALPLAERTTLYLGAKVAGLYMDGDLDARNTDGGATVQQTRDSENWFAVQGTLSAGIEFGLWGAAVAKIGAEGTYLSGAPQIENPQADPGTFVDANYYGASQLGHDSAWSGQVMVSVSFALFGP